MKVAAFCQVRTMICLHDWELAKLRFLPGQVFCRSQVGEYDSFTERDLNFAFKLQWLEMSRLFPSVSIDLAILPPHCYNTSAPYVEVDCK